VPAERLRQGCQVRADLVQAGNKLTAEASTTDFYRQHRVEIDGIIEPLIAGFAAHKEEETGELTTLLAKLTAKQFRTKWSPLCVVMWPWHSEGPAVLALPMALWAGASPRLGNPICSPACRTRRRSRCLWTGLKLTGNDPAHRRWPDRSVV